MKHNQITFAFLCLFTINVSNFIISCRTSFVCLAKLFILIKLICYFGHFFFFSDMIIYCSYLCSWHCSLSWSIDIFCVYLSNFINSKSHGHIWYLRLLRDVNKNCYTFFFGLVEKSNINNDSNEYGFLFSFAIRKRKQFSVVKFRNMKFLLLC